MKRLCAVVLAAVFVLGASPAYACHDRYSDRYGYYDDDCDSRGDYCDGYRWYESSDRDYRYHRRYYYDGDRGACVFHESVGAITFDFLCTYR